MIQVTLNDILNNAEIFRELSTKSLPVKTAFKVARLIRELDKENTTFDESRRQIIEKYAERDENGIIKQTAEGNIQLQQDKIEECNNELVELLNTTIEINVDKISIDALGDIKITPAQMINLEAFIEE
jgi:hypothetical protein